ncbi:MAG TPA: hypothetical protein VFS43_40115 [Polyangiaceae bacterium]|nr:hypothetical protein [Polyangiaceae bacterium]
MARDGGLNPSGLSVRLCLDARCEDRPLEAGRPTSDEKGAPGLAFDLALDGLDPRRVDHLAAVSLYSPGQRAPLFTDVREFTFFSGGGCQGFDCGTFSCGPPVVAFDIPDDVAPAAPCGAGAGGELVVAVRAEEALVLASPTLFAEVCVDSACREARVSVPEGQPAGGDLVTIVVPLGAQAFAGGEHVVKLALGYESGAPLYTDARLMSFDPGALCGREGEADVVFSINADALPTRPTPRPIPDAGTTEP